MIHEVTDKQIKMLIDYVKDDKKNVPYLYANLCAYDLDNKNVRVFCDSDDTIIGVYLLYYDCLHFYTKKLNDYPIETLMGKVRELSPHVIMLQEGIGLKAIPILEKDYFVEVNHIIDMDQMSRSNENGYKSVLAARDIIPGIADLMLSADEYRAVYSRDILIKQLLDRFDSGSSRFYVVIENNEVVAVESSYAETDDLAILSGLVVHPDWRRRGLAEDVLNNLSNALDKEGKTRIGFLNENNEKSIALHVKLGAIMHSKYIKFIRK